MELPGSRLHDHGPAVHRSSGGRERLALQRRLGFATSTKTVSRAAGVSLARLCRTNAAMPQTPLGRGDLGVSAEFPRDRVLAAPPVTGFWPHQMVASTVQARVPTDHSRAFAKCPHDVRPTPPQTCSPTLESGRALV